METALVTGMFETSFLPNKQVGLDVKNGSMGSFNEILESSLKNNDVIKSEVKDCNINKDVSSDEIEVEVKDDDLSAELVTKDFDDNEDVSDVDSEELENIEEDGGKPKKKGKKLKEDFADGVDVQSEIRKFIRKDDLVEQNGKNKIEEVEVKDIKLEENEDVKLVGSIMAGDSIELDPEDKLNDLLSKLNVELSEDVELKDESEQVIEVGPQSVETEKIKLNIKDVENVEIQNSNELEKISQNLVEDKSDPFMQESDAIELKDVDDLGNYGLEEEIEQLKVEVNKEDVSEEEVSKKDVNKAGTSKLEDVEKELGKDVEDKDFIAQNVSKDLTEENSFEEKDKGFSKTKEDKVKVKDFRSKNDVEGIEKFIKEEELKLDSSLKIKDVDNIRQFENIDVDQMDILNQVTEKLEVSLFDNKSEMVIKLKPNDLGNVTVKITIENGVMNAKFLAESEKVKETLESNLNNLKESLKEQGLNVQDLNVSVDNGRSQNHNFGQNNLIYLNDKKSYQSSRAVSYESYKYESADSDKNVSNYWVDSTVSFLA